MFGFNNKQAAKKTSLPLHKCYWPGCGKQVSPELYMCGDHWFMLPKYLRDKVWNVYEAGQEGRGDATQEYRRVASEVHNWIVSQPKTE